MPKVSRSSWRPRGDRFGRVLGRERPVSKRERTVHNWISNILRFPVQVEDSSATTGYRTLFGFQLTGLQLETVDLRFPVIDPVAVNDVWFGGEIYGRKALALQPARDVVGKDPCRRYRGRMTARGDRFGRILGRERPARGRRFFGYNWISNIVRFPVDGLTTGYRTFFGFQL